jgi:hypothetical protein
MLCTRLNQNAVYIITSVLLTKSVASHQASQAFMSELLTSMR